MRILKSAKALFLNIILVVTVIAVFVLLSAVIRNNLADDYVLVNDRVSAEIEYAEGRHSVIAEPEGLRFGKVGAGDVITLNVHLPSDPLITDGDLALCVYSTTVEVWYHNTLLGMYGQESAQKGRMVGKQYCFIPIPDSVWGDEFTIILHPTEKDAFTNLPSHLFIVKKEAAHMLMLRGQSASFFITVILMAFGLFGSIACAFGVTGQFTAKKSFYICVAALLVSLWMFCAYGFYAYLGFSSYFWQVLEYIAGFLSAIPFLLLCREISKDNSIWHRIFAIASVVIGIANIAVMILNFTNVLHFTLTEKYMYVLMLICIGLIAGYSFLHRKKDKASRALFKGIVIFLLICAFDVCKLLFPHQKIWVYFTNLVSLGVLFLFIYLLIYLFIDYTEEKSKALLLQVRTERLKDELELSRVRTMVAQMQPHFLYNALSSIRQIVYEDPEYAGKLISDFTVHLRATIRSMSNDRMVPFSEELRNTKAYVNIEKVRLGDKLTVQYDIQAKDFDIIPLSIQPLVENAIRHGIFHKPGGGCVTLKSYETQEAWIIQVIDDGVGFDKTAVMQEVKDGVRDSTGLQNMIFRLETLMKATVMIDSQPDVGTKISIEIPKNINS